VTCSSYGSALKCDPSKMARAFNRSMSNSWPVQNNDSKTWTDHLLNTPLVGQGSGSVVKKKPCENIRNHSSQGLLCRRVWKNAVFDQYILLFLRNTCIHLHYDLNSNDLKSLWVTEKFSTTWASRDLLCYSWSS